MRIYHCDHFLLPLPRGHRFPMEKYSMLRDRVESAWSEKGIRLLTPEGATDAELESAHSPDYVRRVTGGTLTTQEMRRIGFPWSPALVERSRRSVGGTLEAARAALEDSLGVNLSGGTHHAFPDRGEGFCVFNDVAVAARVLMSEGRAARILILDTDVHQGNGTAFIFREDPDVFTLSIHGANNFPFRKEPSDLDIELPDGTRDGAYLEALSEGLNSVLPGSAFDLAFFLSGADPFEGDHLGRLSLSKQALRERDRLVLAACRRAGIPVAIVMGGGYARPVEHTVEIHFNTVSLVAELALSR